MYRIQPFIWQKLLNDQTVFQTQSSTVIIQNKELSNYLIALEKNNKLEITSQEIEDFWGSKTNEIIDFLTNQKLLVPEVEQEIYLKKI